MVPMPMWRAPWSNEDKSFVSLISLLFLSISFYSLYKKAGIKKQNKKVTYVVSRKAMAGKKMQRPRGVKGPYKVVDPRLKKDMRAKKRAESKKKHNRKRKH